MGIPSYFSYIVKNHTQIIKKYTKDIKVNSFYLDCNSIIYDVYNTILDSNKKQDSNKNSHAIIQNVIFKIEEYVKTVGYPDTVMIAFDGVAPVSKLEQQRQRRYKTWHLNKEDMPTTSSVSSIDFTPGTAFMAELNKQVYSHFSSTNTTMNESNKKIKYIVSGSDKAGEGEHKLFEYMRLNHSSKNIFVYGLDADLIMLSLNHLPMCPNIYLFRETPHFIQSLDSSLEPNAVYYLDIPEFMIALKSELANKDTVVSSNIVYDYIFMCFLLGNDFLPHFPALNIRTGGINKLLNVYKETIGNAGLSLTNGRTIYWKNVRIFIKELASLEEEYIVTEHKTRNKKERNKLPNSTDEEKKLYFESIPLYEREIEKKINPLKSGWQDRYYLELFLPSNTNINTNIKEKEINVKEISINYLEGLEWTMKYYTTGCPNWRWKYKYMYPPLLTDLLQYIPVENKEFVPYLPANPVTEFVQLCYVLPRAYLYLLPKRIYFPLLHNKHNWYKNDCKFLWAYCRYFWESHALLPEIDIDELETLLKDIH